jgi:hypothetical protein
LAWNGRFRRLSRIPSLIHIVGICRELRELLSTQVKVSDDVESAFTEVLGNRSKFQSSCNLYKIDRARFLYLLIMLSFRPEMMNKLNLQSRFRRVFAIGAASLIVAGSLSLNDLSKVHATGTTSPESVITRRPPVVPEANPGIVLLPFFLAAILLSSRRLLGQRVG